MSCYLIPKDFDQHGGSGTKRENQVRRQAWLFQNLIDQHHLIFRLLLTSVSSQSWTVGRQPSTTISNVVSCAAHCANLRQSDPCSCNAIVYVRETGDCIVGTARLPLKSEDTERVFIVEGTGGLVFSFHCRVCEKQFHLTFRSSRLDSLV